MIVSGCVSDQATKALISATYRAVAFGAGANVVSPIRTKRSLRRLDGLFFSVSSIGISGGEDNTFSISELSSSVRGFRFPE